MNQEYIQRLEMVVKQMLQPLKDIPFNLVIEGLTNHKVVGFNENSTEHTTVLNILRDVALSAGHLINKEPIRRRRPNEAGNAIEPYVIAAFKLKGIQAEPPLTPKGHRKASGYPDILFWFNGLPYYLECKTYKSGAVNSSFRTFYFSPSEEMKVTYDTIHFLLSFELLTKSDSSGGYIFTCAHYKIISLDTLSLDVKYEFNSDNRRLYSNAYGAKTLAEGQID